MMDTLLIQLELSLRAMLNVKHVSQALQIVLLAKTQPWLPRVLELVLVLLENS